MPESPNPNPYDRTETEHWYRDVKSDLWWLSQMPISGAAMSYACGYTANKFAPSSIRESVWGRVSRLIDAIETRQLCFFDPKRKRAGRHYVWVDPQPKTIARMPREEFWSLWASCSSCGRNQFLPLRIAGDERSYVACYHCIPPSQYRQIGAYGVSKSLIHEALKNYH